MGWTFYVRWKKIILAPCKTVTCRPLKNTYVQFVLSPDCRTAQFPPHHTVAADSCLRSWLNMFFFGGLKCVKKKNNFRLSTNIGVVRNLRGVLDGLNPLALLGPLFTERLKPIIKKKLCFVVTANVITLSRDFVR